ncbi:hypothetical protein WOLCODRAFT_154362 [Wolfiporia cocos MD-104 SS10]|uniref:Uncharacterized protein n=1 Tax=Wolfiporia cocos (strain MD-104) TaxID=742152 RepID=A0A2H3K7B0_WOLCO|nr:hypothetical protein WOLCODRAFT_154362 [Wolfiporia cocos MD-104 SS10]
MSPPHRSVTTPVTPPKQKSTKPLITPISTRQIKPPTTSSKQQPQSTLHWVPQRPPTPKPSPIHTPHMTTPRVATPQATTPWTATLIPTRPPTPSPSIDSDNTQAPLQSTTLSTPSIIDSEDEDHDYLHPTICKIAMFPGDFYPPQPPLDPELLQQPTLTPLSEPPISTPPQATSPPSVPTAPHTTSMPINPKTPGYTPRHLPYPGLVTADIHKTTVQLNGIPCRDLTDPSLIPNYYITHEFINALDDTTFYTKLSESITAFHLKGDFKWLDPNIPDYKFCSSATFTFIDDEYEHILTALNYTIRDFCLDSSETLFHNTKLSLKVLNRTLLF